MNTNKFELLANRIANEMRDCDFTDDDWKTLRDNVMRLLGNRVRVTSDFIDNKGKECKLDVIYIVGSPSFTVAINSLIASGAKFTVEPLSTGNANK